MLIKGPSLEEMGRHTKKLRQYLKAQVAYQYAKLLLHEVRISVEDCCSTNPTNLGIIGILCSTDSNENTKGRLQWALIDKENSERKQVYLIQSYLRNKVSWKRLSTPGKVNKSGLHQRCLDGITTLPLFFRLVRQCMGLMTSQLRRFRARSMRLHQHYVAPLVPDDSLLRIALAQNNLFTSDGASFSEGLWSQVNALIYYSRLECPHLFN